MPFESSLQNDYILIKLTGPCRGDENPGLVESFQKLLETTELKRVVVQCFECQSTSINFVRQLVQVYKAINARSGIMRLVGAHASMLDLIKSNGLDRILINRVNLRSALVDFGLEKPQDFDVSFVNPFLNAIKKILKSSCRIEASPQRPCLKKPRDPLLLGDISGILTISAETFKGSLAISFPENVFLGVVSDAWGEECKAVNDKSISALRELSRLILEQAKIELSLIGYTIQIASTGCIWGEDRQNKPFLGGVCIVVPFETDAGVFHAEVMANANLLNAFSRTIGSDNGSRKKINRPKTKQAA